MSLLGIETFNVLKDFFFFLNIWQVSHIPNRLTVWKNKRYLQTINIVFVDYEFRSYEILKSFDSFLKFR